MNWLVYGGQYGSEGKGAICAHLAKSRRFAFTVRGGGPQAGHTFWARNKKCTVRQIPVASVVSRNCVGYIGPGAVISPAVIEYEVNEYNPKIFIHPHVTIVSPSDVDMEEQLVMSGNMPGSTKEGVGAARSRRALRTAPTIQHFPSLHKYVDWDLHIYEEMLDAWGRGDVLIEGAQGYGLSLYHGQYPYVTSADTTPPAILSECGLPAGGPTNILAVVRTYPIRVAGHSGPLPHEIDWRGLDREPEITTVTKRERRVAQFDASEYQKMLNVTRPDFVALTFCDYLPGFTDRIVPARDRAVQQFMHENRIYLGPKVQMYGIGGERYEVKE